MVKKKHDNITKQMEAVKAAYIETNTPFTAKK
jgi:hypothetical protein